MLGLQVMLSRSRRGLVQGRGTVLGTEPSKRREPQPWQTPTPPTSSVSSSTYQLGVLAVVPLAL